MSDARNAVIFSLSFAAMSFTAAAGFGLAGWVGGRALDPCSLPPGMQLGALPEHDRSLALRHALACIDLENGRISADEFRQRLRPPAPPPAPLPDMVWASSVRSFSSQYTVSSYSASHALGAPDVFPQSGDMPNAWASLEADGGPETIEVGFDGRWSAGAVAIYETFNPGAVSLIEVITADGQRHAVFQGAAAPSGQAAQRRLVDFGCTAEPVVGVRVTLDSRAVPGWNEIDAIGIQPCVATPAGT